VSPLVLVDVTSSDGVVGRSCVFTYSAAAAVAGLARARGLPVSNHLFPEVSAHLMCATPTARWFQDADWWNAVLDHPLRLDSGYAVMDETSPGSGITWNEDVVSRHLAT